MPVPRLKLSQTLSPYASAAPMFPPAAGASTSRPSSTSRTGKRTGKTSSSPQSHSGAWTDRPAMGPSKREIQHAQSQEMYTRESRPRTTNSTRIGSQRAQTAGDGSENRGRKGQRDELGSALDWMDGELSSLPVKPVPTPEWTATLDKRGLVDNTAGIDGNDSGNDSGPGSGGGGGGSFNPGQPRKPSTAPPGRRRGKSMRQKRVALRPKLETAFNALSLQAELSEKRGSTAPLNAPATATFPLKASWRPLRAEELLNPSGDVTRKHHGGSSGGLGSRGTSSLLPPRPRRKKKKVGPMGDPAMGALSPKPFNLDRHRDKQKGGSDDGGAAGGAGAGDTNNSGDGKDTEEDAGAAAIARAVLQSRGGDGGGGGRSDSFSAPPVRVKSPALTLLGDRFVFERNGLRVGRIGIEELPLPEDEVPEPDFALKDLSMVIPLSEQTVVAPGALDPEETRVWLSEHQSRHGEKHVIKWFNISNHKERVMAFRAISVGCVDPEAPEQIIPVTNAFLEPKKLRIAVVSPAQNMVSLDSAMKDRTPMAEALLSVMMRELLTGLAWLHSERHVVHNYLQPERIGVDTDTGGVRLFSFEYATMASDEAPPDRPEDFPSVAFMAPERLLQLQTCARSDIWALGVLAMTLLWGKHPLEPQSCANLLELKERYVQATLWNELEGVSPQCSSFLQRCLHKYPHERWGANDLLNHEFIRGYIHLESQALAAWVGVTNPEDDAELRSQVESSKECAYVDPGPLLKKNLDPAIPMPVRLKDVQERALRQKAEAAGLPPPAVVSETDMAAQAQFKFYKEEDILGKWFKQYAAKGKDYLGCRELCRMLRDLGEVVTEDMVERTIATLETRHVGRLTLKEFIRHFSNMEFMEKMEEQTSPTKR